MWASMRTSLSTSTRSPSGLSFAQFLRAARRLEHRLHDGAAEPPLFQRVETCDRRPPGRGYLVAQLAQMLAAFERHARGAEDGLERELQRHFPAEPHLHAAVGERFDEEKNVRRPAAGKPGNGVEVFFFQRKADPEAVEDRADLFEIGGLGSAAAGVAGGAGADDAGDVGHDANHARSLGEILFQPRERHARGDGNDQFRFADFFGDLLYDRIDHLRLDREDHDIREVAELQVAGGRLDAELGGPRLAQRLASVARPDLVGPCETGAYHAAGDRGADLAGADDADFLLERFRHAVSLKY